MTPALLNIKTYAVFDRREPSQDLSELCIKLLSEQKKTWPDLAQGYETLNNIRAREILCNGFSVRVQHNPGRARSTLADVGEKSVNERPCFLCIGNLPADQKGILYQKEYLILCNPMPVFSGHFTIARLVHQPQAIAEHIDTFLQLMGDFGDSWSILYNGPRCGASAPDHLHFQAIPAGKMPIEKEITGEKGLVEITQIDSVRISRAKGLGRETIVLESDGPTAMASVFKSIMTTLKSALNGDQEPMMSVAGFRDGNKWLLVVFPRAKHRPEAFFRQGTDRVVVSPAVIEMGGVLVTPLEKDYKRLDESVVEAIFREVSLFLPW
jgi:hypothetical protein